MQPNRCIRGIFTFFQNLLVFQHHPSARLTNGRGNSCSVTRLQLCNFDKAIRTPGVLENSGDLLSKAESTVLAGKQVALFHFFPTFRTNHNSLLLFIIFPRIAGPDSGLPHFAFKIFRVYQGNSFRFVPQHHQAVSLRQVKNISGRLGDDDLTLAANGHGSPKMLSRRGRGECWWCPPYCCDAPAHLEKSGKTVPIGHIFQCPGWFPPVPISRKTAWKPQRFPPHTPETAPSYCAAKPNFQQAYASPPYLPMIIPSGLFVFHHTNLSYFSFWCYFFLPEPNYPKKAPEAKASGAMLRDNRI